MNQVITTLDLSIDKRDRIAQQLMMPTMMTELDQAVLYPNLSK
jgi:hypothetical protein